MQATDSYGHVHRHVLKLLKKADIKPPTPRHRSKEAKRQANRDSQSGVSRKPVHAILPEEELDEIPVHGPGGK